jgi:hypothetical protein
MALKERCVNAGTGAICFSNMKANTDRTWSSVFSPHILNGSIKKKLKNINNSQILSIDENFRIILLEKG